MEDHFLRIFNAETFDELRFLSSTTMGLILIRPGPRRLVVVGRPQGPPIEMPQLAGIAVVTMQGPPRW